MQKIIVGLIVGIVVGILFGASVVAPRLKVDPIQQSVAHAVDTDTGDGDGSVVIPVELASEQPMSPPPNGGFVINFASSISAEHPGVGALPNRLEEMVRSISGGQAALIFHAPHTLAPVAEMMEAVRAGAVDAAFMAINAGTTQIPVLDLFGNAPFGPDPAQLISWLDGGDGQLLLHHVLEKRGLFALPCGLSPTHSAGWFEKEISTVSDLSNLRMATEGFGARVLNTLGTETVAIPPSEAANALKTGKIDAATGSSPSADLANGFQHVAKYYYFPPWHSRATLLGLFMRLETWKRLGHDAQSLLTIVCGDTLRYSLALGQVNQFEALKRISGSGVTVSRLPEDVLLHLHDAWSSIVEKQAGDDKEFDTVWRSHTNFWRDYDILTDLGRL